MIKLNIGCGPNGQFPGFVNMDNSPSVWISKSPFLKRTLYRLGVINQNQLKDNWTGVIKCDASKHIPYNDGSVDKIYSSHFLEHIPYSKGLHFLHECYRVLKEDGVLRLVVPDLLWHAERYISKTQQILSANKMERQSHDEFLETVYGAYLSKTRYGGLHCYMYDFPTLVVILQSIGFRSVTQYDYRQGHDFELASFDSRPEDSLHLEIRKTVYPIDKSLSPLAVSPEFSNKP